MRLVLKLFFLFSVLSIAKVEPATLTHICNPHRFVYYVVPKTGYSSLHTMLVNNNRIIGGQVPHHVGPLLTYFKFAFVRNPWDRVVSAYENIIRTHRMPNLHYLDPNQSFEEFVQYLESTNLEYEDVHFRLQTVLVPIEEMDFIGRFENLENDLNLLMEMLELENREILHLNKTEHTHYSHYYTDETRDIIARIYKTDIEAFNYKFEQEPISSESEQESIDLETEQVT